MMEHAESSCNGDRRDSGSEDMRCSKTHTWAQEEALAFHAASIPFHLPLADEATPSFICEVAEHEWYLRLSLQTVTLPKALQKRMQQAQKSAVSGGEGDEDHIDGDVSCLLYDPAWLDSLPAAETYSFTFALSVRGHGYF